MKFNEHQIEFMKKIGIEISTSNDLSDSDYIIIEERISNYLQMKGFNSDYEPTEEGRMCETILDML